MSEPENTRARYYPLFLDIGGRTCLVVGGGAVGERKVRTLLEHGARVRLVARELTPWLEEECAAGGIILAGTEYGKAHLQGAVLVFAATSDAELNRAVSEDARGLGTWCNMATDPELGSFIVPSLVQRGPLAIAVSTAGLSPAIARVLRIRLEGQFGAEWEFFILLLGELRKFLKSRGIEEKDSRRVFSELAALPLPEWIAEGGREKAFQKVSEICGPLLGGDELQPIWDKLWKPFSSSSQRFAT
ncbi:MAG: bifunctional precorrin-2 dehydrogenase/sirohydrochlorin ferrochelatase [Syntrophobacteraceae bacterium]